MNVLFFGGSFDPPHVAHVLSVTYALCTGNFQRALVVPVFEHAFGKRLCPFQHRLRMCELAFGGLPAVEVSGVEAELGRPNYTLHTLEHLAGQNPDWQLRLLVGSDVLADTSKWLGFDEVARRAPPVVVSRGAGPGPALLPDVSSTRVRSLLAARSDAAARLELERLLPRAVLEYVEANGLYQGSEVEPRAEKA